MCILSVHTLLKVVNYYDLSVLSMSVMVSTTTNWGGGWVSGVSSIQVWVFVKSRDPGKLPGYDAACTRLSSGWKIGFYCYLCPSRFTIIVYNV